MYIYGISSIACAPFGIVIPGYVSSLFLYKIGIGIQGIPVIVLVEATDREFSFKNERRNVSVSSKNTVGGPRCA